MRRMPSSTAAIASVYLRLVGVSGVVRRVPNSRNTSLLRRVRLKPTVPPMRRHRVTLLFAGDFVLDEQDYVWKQNWK